MAGPAAPGSVIVPDWHESAQGKEYLACILRKSRRRVFGLLERPVLPPPVAIDTASYKIFVSGKSGVGKTALVAKLAGLEVPVVHHETTGIQTTVVFWPAKLQASDRVVMFRFEFWDCGESALKKFEHMLPACKENADAFLFLFSFTDRASFEDLPGQLARVAGEAPGVVRMVIGSKFDQYVHTDVPERDLAAFRQKCGFPPRTGHGACQGGWRPGKALSSWSSAQGGGHTALQGSGLRASGCPPASSVAPGAGLLKTE
uniref:Ciliogenesis and planar polarity effector 2 n=1 Tax=Bos taurus TaxID=9913 RepID=A0AAA9U0H5_BOVIN